MKQARQRATGIMMNTSNVAPECLLTFTPIESAIGGLLIGCSAAIMLLCYGRVLGFSGILVQSAAPLFAAKPPALWRVSMLLGLVLGGGICGAIPAGGFPAPTIESNEGVYILAGLAVGFGASVGNGCTSGHGICGLGRLSPRSFISVCTFMAAGLATSIIAIRGVANVDCSGVSWIAWPPAVPSHPAALLLGAFLPLLTTLALVAAATMSIRAERKLVRATKADDGAPRRLSLAWLLSELVPLCVGITSGIGLVQAGMLQQHKVRGFLNLAGQWDPSLGFVMGAGATVSLAAHRLAARWPQPFLLDAYAYPITCEFGQDPLLAAKGGGRGRRFDPSLLGGSLLFGCGWGMLGICPGPSIVGLAAPIVAAAQGDAWAAGAPWRFPLDSWPPHWSGCWLVSSG